MKKKAGGFLLLFVITVFCFTLPVNAAGRFKKVSSNMKGAVKVSSASIYKEVTVKSKSLKKLKFGDKVLIKSQSENWYEVKKGSIKGYMKKSSVVMYHKKKKHVALTFDD